ncbi:MAG: hypothetical protein VX739_14665 [Planctomycetota bacterium]|nr:hypothetical protein [Planctomycetota bacterium]
MPTFAFVARDEAGQSRRGAVEAASASIVASQLRMRGWIVVTLEEQLSGASNSSAGNAIFSGIFAPRNVQVELSLRQLAVMLNGGISLLSAMQTISTQSDSRAIRRSYG